MKTQIFLGYLHSLHKNLHSFTILLVKVTFIFIILTTSQRDMFV